MLIPNKFNGYGTDGIRLYRKGGDAGAGAAQQQEAARQSRIDSAVGVINGIFDNAGRDELYADQKKAVYDINALDVNKQYKEAERANRFGLARAGLAGGSADIDSNAELQERTNKGLIQATGLGDSAASDLKLADERSRQSLIGMAQSGIDTGTAQTMALNQLNATQQSAAGDRAGATIGNLFGDLGQAYLASQIRAGQVAGKNYGSSSYGVSNVRSGDAGSVIRS
jgi:hypothetical protein